MQPLDNIWRGGGWGYRVAFGVIMAGGFLPLGLLLFTHDRAPLWEQWIAVAVFTPIGLIGEWIVFTGRTTIRRLRPAHKCAACGYDLRATAGRCPECGTVPPVSRISN